MVNNTAVNILEVASLCKFLWDRISGCNGVPVYILIDAEFYL